jgi:hypothetical protein
MEAVEIIKKLLTEPYGCPMCDSGKLRSPEKQHWYDCPYLLANNFLAELEAISTPSPMQEEDKYLEKLARKMGIYIDFSDKQYDGDKEAPMDRFTFIQYLSDNYKKPQQEVSTPELEAQPSPTVQEPSTEQADSRNQWVKHFNPPFKHAEDSTFILDSHGNIVIEVRGWGHLSNLMTDIKACEVQDQIANHITDILNSSTEHKKEGGGQ